MLSRSVPICAFVTVPISHSPRLDSSLVVAGSGSVSGRLLSGWCSLTDSGCERAIQSEGMAENNDTLDPYSFRRFGVGLSGVLSSSGLHLRESEEVQLNGLRHASVTGQNKCLWQVH